MNVKKDGKKVYYHYEHSDFSINKQPLTDEEAQQLQTVILTLSRFRGLKKLYLILNGDLTSKGRMKMLLALIIRVLLSFSNQ